MIPKHVLAKDSGLTDWAILQGYRGSIAHGMYVPPEEPTSIDDKDVMSICVPPEDYYIGLAEYGSRGTREIKHETWDIVIYEIKKFISLLAKANPNVTMLLWLDPKHYTKITPAGEMLIAERSLFSTRLAYQSFVGYATGQLHRMTHYKFEGYMGEKRKTLVDKFGFDTKNAAHLIRLLRTGVEFLSTGVMLVERPDAQELLEIKRGEWPLEKVKEEAAKLFDMSREANMRSPLPIAPDKVKVNELCKSVIKTVWRAE